MARVKWDDSLAKRIAKRAGLKAGRVVGEKLKGISDDEAPHATGTMERSADVSDDGESIIHVSYNTPYAVKQHEDLSLRHPDPTNPISSSGRKAKFLEDPLNANKKKWQKFIGLAIKTALKKGSV
ncbi:MAG: hypothetical protein PHO41_09255 [Eubacteriales bacterium]|nr:hypothetical protein [Eubacteriales bacterium]